MMGQLMGSLLGGGASVSPASQPAENQGEDLMSGIMGAFMGSAGAGQTTSQSAAPQGADLLGGLLGSMMGAGEQPPSTQQQAGSQGSDLLGGLMGALLGGSGATTPSQSGQDAGGLDLNAMLGLASAVMGQGQQGGSPVQTVVNSLLNNSQMNDSPHHSQSGQLVTSTLINSLGAMMGGKQR